MPLLCGDISKDFLAICGKRISLKSMEGNTSMVEAFFPAIIAEVVKKLPNTVKFKLS
jgi:hypothetical protein